MSNNPFRNTISPGRSPVLIYSKNAIIGELLHKTLAMIGFSMVKVVDDEASAIESLDSFAPKAVIMFANMKDVQELRTVKIINKTRASDNRRTPKILALMHPSAEQIVKAKADGFWDVLSLPATPNALSGRLETVMTRLD
jgi:PleD family two-component response regulator